MLSVDDIPALELNISGLFSSDCLEVRDFDEDTIVDLGDGEAAFVDLGIDKAEAAWVCPGIEDGVCVDSVEGEAREGEVRRAALGEKEPACDVLGEVKPACVVLGEVKPAFVVLSTGVSVWVDLIEAGAALAELDEVEVVLDNLGVEAAVTNLEVGEPTAGDFGVAEEALEAFAVELEEEGSFIWAFFPSCADLTEAVDSSLGDDSDITDAVGDSDVDLCWDLGEEIFVVLGVDSVDVAVDDTAGDIELITLTGWDVTTLLSSSRLSKMLLAVFQMLSLL